MERKLWVKSHILPLYDKGKDLEVRTGGRYINDIREQDVIVINGQIKRRVIAIRRYIDFDAMLTIEDSDRIYPKSDKQTIKHGLERIYTRRSDDQGVVVFELVLE